MWLGAHIGIADGLAEVPRIADEVGCASFQIFSKSPKLWAGPPVSPEAAAAFRTAVQTVGIRATSVHHGYLVNLASPKKAGLARSRIAFLDELQRAELLGVDSLIFHPGAYLESAPETGVATLVESLNRSFEKTAGFKVRVLLENSAGQGTSIGSTFGQLAEVLGKLDDRARAGVAIDTCHLFASGVEFRTEESYGAMVDALDTTVGLSDVRAFHLNDAKADLGSHLDRHENIGVGQLGLSAFGFLVNDPRWATVPGYLETPLGEGDGYAAYRADLAKLRSLIVDGPGAAGRRPGTSPRSRRPTPK